MFDIIHYEKANSEKPVDEFLMSLDIKMRVKVLRNIGHLKLNGYKLREPLSSPLRDGIFELRTQTAGNITRILFFFYTGNKIVLTHGFIKKTPKTPQSEIERALRYKNDYITRKESESHG
ncbi:type II toxin-antitoxin system RelE/ParE family toxin [Anaerovibrio sp. RM50]|uniref:type II toxin-antitoxin system RelE/ParE family toxin n=1 Tax=Anaerovibrio sp. RM50 TaxID=1200557 RepID=UPI0005682B22|nr:type II toxin-antitoxin system RelE/ParE family toxin [Anaerovibrio sp. RM50]